MGAADQDTAEHVVGDLQAGLRDVTSAVRSSAANAGDDDPAVRAWALVAYLRAITAYGRVAANDASVFEDRLDDAASVQSAAATVVLTINAWTLIIKIQLAISLKSSLTTLGAASGSGGSTGLPQEG
ncbi:HEAT repeat containing protein [Haloferax mucosum ATCC BAA-1512]|uniref:HEAT repeat containing protein n=1 Tax=Haloferax mucosum ATCC BAA-1512 TaxID=662479 RepID=M0IIA3_9EURY|nr:hypothetical protein [Haloferax mucosum]ELZ95787.1 HEAT repeat containing protein [Haloferax mucosum ATCC BAA-1512]